MMAPSPARATGSGTRLRRLACLAAALLLTGCGTLQPAASGSPAAVVEATPAGVVATGTATTVAPTPTPAPTAIVQPAADRAPTTPPAATAEVPPVVSRPEDRPEGLRGQFGAESVVDTARADLWERVRQGFAMEDLDNALVRKWEAWYATRPEYVERMMDRGARYLFHIVEEVQARGLPMELALLPFIESAFNPQAMSVARASGMWQFMPATGKHFELKQNLFRDDRRSVLASTRAALDYLQLLNRTFEDWTLALAAYNWGQGNVQRAQASNRRAGLPTAYADLRMPDETRNYVPKLQAIKNIVMRPEAFGLKLPRLENHPFFLTVAIDRDIDVDLVLRLARISREDFQALNPQLNKPVVLAAGTPTLLLPYDEANRFVAALARHRGPLSSWTVWVAPRTLRPAEAARIVGMPEPELRELNRIPARMLVKAGSALLVPRAPNAAQDVNPQLADNARLALAPEAVARKGKGGKSRADRPSRTTAAAGKPGPRTAAPAKAKPNAKTPAAGAQPARKSATQTPRPSTQTTERAAARSVTYR